MPVTIVVGEQRGDEGKGRFVDMLAAEHDVVARFNGGPNAGHTVVLPDGLELALHVIPSGVAYRHTLNIIGNGTFIDAARLDKEKTDTLAKGLEVSPRNLRISASAHLILPSYISDDEVREAGPGRQGSTKSGIAQAAGAKYLRTGLRAEIARLSKSEIIDLIKDRLNESNERRKSAGLKPLDVNRLAAEFADSVQKLKDYIDDTALLINQKLRADAKVLVEGAQAFWLDVDHGMYPFTTSSSTTSGGVMTGLGIGPRYVDRIIGVAKATQSHVGGGPFVTEITDEALLERLRGSQEDIDGEYGTTTGRPRRIGHLDLPQIRRAQIINGTMEMGLTKMDCVPRYGDKIMVCVAYKTDTERLEIAPSSARDLETCQPVYEELPCWSEDVQDVRKFDDLPKEARNYIEFIESKTDVPIKFVGVGPKRDQVIVR